MESTEPNRRRIARRRPRVACVSVRDVLLFSDGIDFLARVDRLAERNGDLADELLPVQIALRAFLRSLADSTHKRRPAPKLRRLTDARGHLCQAVADLLRVACERSEPEYADLADRLESRLVGSLHRLIARLAEPPRRPRELSA